MFAIFILGMAGSGKTMLTGIFQEWLRFQNQKVLSLNLDPGALNIPYNPDIDIRTFINLNELMEKFKLGPNGALILASDMIADHIEEIQLNILEVEPDVLLIDTPGQIELFAFRESGPFVTREISQDRKVVIYLLDAPFCKNPVNYVSSMFLATAVYNRLLLPQVYTLSKIDLINEDERFQIQKWTEDENSLIQDLNQIRDSIPTILIRDLALALQKTGLFSELIPISIKTEEGFTELYAALTRITSGGEPFTL